MTEILSIDLIDAISPKDSERTHTHTEKLRMLQCRPTTRQWIWRESEDRCTVSRSNALLTQVDCMRLFVLVLVDSAPFWFGFGFHLVGLFVDRSVGCFSLSHCCQAVLQQEELRAAQKEQRETEKKLQDHRSRDSIRWNWRVPFEAFELETLTSYKLNQLVSDVANTNYWMFCSFSPSFHGQMPEGCRLTL